MTIPKVPPIIGPWQDNDDDFNQNSQKFTSSDLSAVHAMKTTKHNMCSNNYVHMQALKYLPKNSWIQQKHKNLPVALNYWRLSIVVSTMRGATSMLATITTELFSANPIAAIKLNNK